MKTQQPAISSSSRSGSGPFRSFRSPAFRFYLPGSLFQIASLSMQIITGPLLMYRLTNSTAMLGTMALIGSIPMIFLSMYGGAIADRLPKKRVIIIGLVGSAVVACGMALMLMSGMVSAEKEGSYWYVIGAVLLMGSLMGIMMPALQALVADIVSRENLMNAVALNMTGMNVLNLVGPGLAGFMIDRFDFASVYFAMMGFYLCSAVLIMLTPVETAARPAEVIKTSIIAEIQSGFRYIRGHQLIFTVLMFSLIATILSMPYQQMLPVFVDDILKVGATGMGILMSVSGAGALVASAFMTILPNKKRGLILILSGIVSGAALIVFSFSAIWGLSLGMMVIIGLGQTVRMAVGSTLLQANAEPEYRGRVMSIFSMQWGLMSLCTFFAGVIAEVLPVQWVLGTLAILLVVVSLITTNKVPSLMKLD